MLSCQYILTKSSIDIPVHSSEIHTSAFVNSTSVVVYVCRHTLLLENLPTMEQSDKKPRQTLSVLRRCFFLQDMNI